MQTISLDLFRSDWHRHRWVSLRSFYPVMVIMLLASSILIRFLGLGFFRTTPLGWKQAFWRSTGRNRRVSVLAKSNNLQQFLLRSSALRTRVSGVIRYVLCRWFVALQVIASEIVPHIPMLRDNHSRVKNKCKFPDRWHPNRIGSAYEFRWVQSPPLNILRTIGRPFL